MRKVVLFGSAAVAAYLMLDHPASKPGLAIAQSERPAPQAAPAERLDLPDRRGLSRNQGELFAAPPPPAPKPVAKKAPPPPAPVAAAPIAPPLPYRLAGKVITGSEEEVFLAKGELVIPVKVGDTLEHTWKVESISAERIELVYLPLGTRERIAASSLLDAQSARDRSGQDELRSVRARYVKRRAARLVANRGIAHAGTDLDGQRQQTPRLHQVERGAVRIDRPAEILEQEPAHAAAYGRDLGTENVRLDDDWRAITRIER